MVRRRQRVPRTPSTPVPTVVLAAARVVTPDAVLAPGWVQVQGPTITAVRSGEPLDEHETQVEDLGAATIVPGFVDLHNHGGGGAAFTDGPAAARTALAAHLTHGTTSVMASLVTDSIDVLEAQVRELVPLVASDDLLGIHLEGPWLSSLHCGAHAPAFLRDPLPADVDRLLQAGSGAVRMVTLAVERVGALDAARHLASQRVLVALGHSHATYEQANRAVDVGVTVATHLYNAERPVHHREPGLVLAMLERDEVTVELIADGVHLHPAIIRAAARRKPGRFMLVTDAMAAAGASDGAYALGPLAVEVHHQVARVAGGDAIAGSTLTLDRAIRFATTEVGLSLLEAVQGATAIPGQLCGRSDIGRLTAGCRADIVVLDTNASVTKVMKGGSWVA